MTEAVSPSSGPITGLQLRVARKLLNWSTDRLAKRARIAVGVVLQAEQHGGTTMVITPPVARMLRQIFEGEGLEFCDDPLTPVRRRPDPLASTLVAG